MTLLNRMTIKTRIILAGVFMVLLFLLFGILSLSQMNRLSDLTATLYEHPLQVSNAALKAKAGVISMHRSMKDVSTSTTQLSATLAIQTVLSEEQKVYAELGIIRDLILGKEGRILVEETTALFAGWKPIRLEVEELVLKGDREAANRITRGKGADYVARLERKMSALTTYARTKADGFMADAEKTEEGILKTTILFIAFMILAGLCMGLLMSASILSSVSALKDTMTHITRSGELTEARIQGKNEITEMAAHFNGLILRLKRQFWLGDGQNHLNEALSGELSYDEILEKSIQTVCRYTDACAGAIYTFNHTEGMCKLKSSYALVERPHLANRFPTGHGIVGQVALEKKGILLTDIGKEDALGQSGTVSRAPDSIYALPLIYEDELYGVLETASFNGFDTVKQKYLKNAAATIAVFLHTAFQQDRIKQLLDSSQSANERLQEQTRELQEQAEELKALNEEFQQQSHELKSQNLALEDQRVKVEEANRLKSEFLSNMSHELRTPLNSVNALSRVLRVQAKEKLTDEELEYLSIIERNGKHLLSLINDILDLSKIEAGRMEIVQSRFSLNALVDTIVEGLSPIAEEKGIAVEKDTDPNLPLIVSDESRVLQIIQNILSNAVKFTQTGGVKVSTLQEDRQTALVRIQDSGIGIDPEDLHGIFEEFRQADGASTRRFEGTGLGLSIAYKAAQLLGGDIRVESLKDSGTTFTVSLPLGAQAENGAGPMPESSYPAPPDRNAVKTTATILAVDDDPAVLSTIASALENGGYTCITADSGTRALELARTRAPDAITLDILMPEMDGWEVMENLKKDAATKDIPVIIVSVSQDRATGAALGAVGYITKPVGRETLLREIKRVFPGLPSRVLVVDDSPLELKQTAGIIREQGIGVDTAGNGQVCMDKLAQGIPDLIVLDLMMPEMDGFEVLKRLREDSGTRHLPVIVVTAKDLNSSERRLLESQTAAILTKGISPETALVDKVNQILEAKGKRTPSAAANPPLSPYARNGSGHRTILLVEDNEAAVIQVKTALDGAGFQVKTAGDGKQALEILHKELPDGLVLDLMMPEVDGFQVLDALGKTPGAGNIPVLILTAKDLTREDRTRLGAHNTRHLIQKGDVDQAELIRHVREMVAPDAPAPDPPPREAPSPVQAVPSSPAPGTKPLVLAVEDNPDNMVTLKAVLGRSCAVIGAADGKQGLEKARSIQPDLILLDISLPVMDGFEVVKALKADSRTGRIPVVALTAQAMKGDRDRILAAGCDDYISKPIDPETITAALNRWVSMEQG